MNQTNYRLDRSKFKMQSFEEADNNYEYWMEKSFEERLKAAYYLISVAYNFDINKPPKFEKTIYATRKHEI